MKYSLAPKKINILITGASGFIGRHLSRHLEKRYNVFNLVSDKSHNSCIKNKIALDLRKNILTITYFRKFAKNNKIDIIIHLASRLVSSNETEDMKILYDNLKITESLVEIAEFLKPNKIINFSTIAVYPNKSGTYSETSEVKTSCNTECLYGLSKFCSENILDYRLRNENIIIAHLRVSQVYGEGMRSDRILSVMLKELKEQNRITLLGKGKRVSCFINIEKLIGIVDLFITKKLSGIFNIGEEHLSYQELAQRVIRQHGNETSKIIKKIEGSTSRFYLDTKKIEKAKNA